MVADALFDSPILQSGMDDMPAAQGGVSGAAPQIQGDSRPTESDLDRLQQTDPELATALRISM